MLAGSAPRLRGNLLILIKIYRCILLLTFPEPSLERGLLVKPLNVVSVVAEGRFAAVGA